MLTIVTIFLAGQTFGKMMIYLIFVIFLIDDRLSDSDRSRRSGGGVTVRDESVHMYDQKNA